jgi:predicted phage-related endonuclease
MSIIIHRDLIQGSDEWHAARCGLLTASEMHLIVTPTMKAASNDKERAHLYELLAQRINQHVEPTYYGYAMMRGHDDEIEAAKVYSQHYGKTDRSVGFVTNDRWGFTIGYSPDGFVGDDGLIECKSKCQKLQVKAILANECPDEHMVQVQTGLMVTERKWCDFVSYCGGMPMLTVRVYPDPVMQAAIAAAAGAFEQKLSGRMAEYQALLASSDARLVPTERRIELEMYQ